MKHVYLLLFMLMGVNSFSQIPEFEFQLYFEDAAGNKDTITLGYDALATDSIDALFGEVDLTSIPWKTSGIEVRISDPKGQPFLYPSYESKKQIINYTCSSANLQQINIFTKNWPVTIIWEAISVDSCIKGSLITSYQPGGWFDVPGPSNMGVVSFFDFFDGGSGGLYGDTFSSNVEAWGSGYPYSYTNSNGDTISAFWQKFGTMELITMGVQQNEIEKQIQVSPNPFMNNFKLSEPISLDKIKLIDLKGNEVYLRKEGEFYTPLKCATGMYFLIIRGEKGQQIFKIIKQ
ncbi:MAG: T9SS type A sorting domain-containing protein [Brumimicrobium sp.]|nr:T9SS type A sorting domain-containing protein [Brumimicrobium sp.]